MDKHSAAVVLVCAAVGYRVLLPSMVRVTVDGSCYCSRKGKLATQAIAKAEGGRAMLILRRTQDTT